jgi:DNA-binding protein HU-beta
MSDRLDKDGLIERVAGRTGQDKAIVAEIIDTTFEEMYEAFKRTEKVSIRNFGTFYIDVRHSGTVFKFNPAQRLRALFGWSSTYKGPL